MPSSMIRWISSGVTTTRPALMIVNARNAMMLRRCGRANARTRRIVLGSIRVSIALRSERRWRQTAPFPCIPDTSTPV
jgi:hypothetical protein